MNPVKNELIQSTFAQTLSTKWNKLSAEQKTSMILGVVGGVFFLASAAQGLGCYFQIPFCDAMGMAGFAAFSYVSISCIIFSSVYHYIHEKNRSHSVRK